MSGKWVDQCTSVKEGDDSYQLASQLVKDTGCAEENTALTNCLHESRKNWARCQVIK